LKSLGLVSCAKKKRDYPCKASELCSPSALFRKAFDYASKNYDAVAILSGKYGLLLPDEEVEPYDRFLKKLSIEQVKEWSNKVFSQMKERLNLHDFDRVYFHAGKRYRQYLIPMLEKMNIKCEVPLKSMGIGRQLAWYKQHDVEARPRREGYVNNQ
jgi:hypothetical protein